MTFEELVMMRFDILDAEIQAVAARQGNIMASIALLARNPKQLHDIMEQAELMNDRLTKLCDDVLKITESKKDDIGKTVGTDK